MGCVCSIRKEIDAEVNVIEDENRIKNKNDIPEENMIEQKEESKEKEDNKTDNKTKEKEDSKNHESPVIEQENESQKNNQNSENNKKNVGILSKEDNQYNYRVFELINQIRKDPAKYAETVIDNIKNIKQETHKVMNKKTGQEEDTNYIVFKKKVKVLLFKGEECFRESAKILENTQPMEELQYCPDMIIPLPDCEYEIKNSSFIKNKVNEMRNNINISINTYFKDYIKNPEVAVLLMVVDDSENNSGKKREAILNPNFKYIGVNSKFIGKFFIAHFSFSK